MKLAFFPLGALHSFSVYYPFESLVKGDIFLSREKKYLSWKHITIELYFNWAHGEQL